MLRRPRQFLLMTCAVALLLATLETATAAMRARFHKVGGGACWIWAPGVQDSAEPIAFHAVRDFELEREAEKAQLMISADESYRAYVNGRPVGSGSYRDEAPADLYDVTADLEPGWNRLVVELASCRGAGGLFASLRVDDRPLLVTDGSWRIYRQFVPGLLRGMTVPAGDPARVWQSHPTGRWRLASPASRPAPPIDPVFLPAQSLRTPWTVDSWLDLARYQRGFPTGIGTWIVLDWGQEVTGHLHLDLASDNAAPGLLHVGDQVPDRESPADGLVIPVPGRETWIDPLARTFRYVLLTGVDLARAPTVHIVPKSEVFVPPELHRGVFGIDPPLRRSLAEEKIRQRLRQ